MNKHSDKANMRPNEWAQRQSYKTVVRRELELSGEFAVAEATNSEGVSALAGPITGTSSHHDLRDTHEIGRNSNPN